MASDLIAAEHLEPFAIPRSQIHEGNAAVSLSH